MYNITVVGTGYVGLVTGACLADFGQNVTCIDSDPSKIERLKANQLPFYEPGLPEMVEGRTVYRTTPEEFAGHLAALREAGAAFIGGCCGTSPDFIRALVKQR